MTNIKQELIHYVKANQDNICKEEEYIKELNSLYDDFRKCAKQGKNSCYEPYFAEDYPYLAQHDVFLKFVENIKQEGLDLNYKYTVSAYTYHVECEATFYWIHD